MVIENFQTKLHTKGLAQSCGHVSKRCCISMLLAAHLGCICDGACCINHVIHQHSHFVLDITNEVHDL